MSSIQDRLYGSKKDTLDMSKYDSTVALKLNFAKAKRLDYRIVTQGQLPKDAAKNYSRFNIVVTEKGKFVSTYYG
jgi:hypothetical protein